MSQYLVTADEHYGHRNIIDSCKRPFADVTRMRDALVERHNAKVPAGNGFTTIHVGDMFWDTMSVEEALAILDRLNGRHAFLYGNHDKVVAQSLTLRERFEWVIGENKAGGSKIIHYNKIPILLSHYSHTMWHQSHKGSWMLFGHSHGKLVKDGLTFDIGVDGHDFEPWTLEEVAREMSKRKSNYVIPADKVWPGKEDKIGGTYHAENCNCGWCNMGMTRA